MLPKRFWEKVKRDPDSGCWLWTGATGRGYGLFQLKGKLVIAHRFAYQRLRGAVPEELQLDHLCRNRACCNPDHLEPVTCRENLLRSPITQAGKNARKTHCDNGHEFTKENTYRWKGHRQCRECNRAIQRAFKNKKRAEKGIPPMMPKAKKTHCAKGHEYTPENTAIVRRSNGRTSRRCKECKRGVDRRNRQS